MFHHSWLSISFQQLRELNTVSSMCYDLVSETTPPYLSAPLHLYIPSHSLRSSADTHTFQIPKQKKKFQG